MIKDKPTRDISSIETVEAGRGTRILVLRGAINGRADTTLRKEMLGALESGANVVLLDLSRVESLSTAAYDLIAAASATLADRGGTVLAWSQKHDDGSPTYLIADVRDRGIRELIADERPTGGASGRRDGSSHRQEPHAR